MVRATVHVEHDDTIGIDRETGVAGADIVGNQQIQPFCLQLAAGILHQILAFGGEANHDNGITRCLPLSFDRHQDVRVAL